jgi:hypothetical protein
MAAPHISFRDLADAKQAMRQRALARDPAAGAALTQQVLRDRPPPGAVVSGFWPIGREIDIRSLMLALHGRGHPVVLSRRSMAVPMRGRKCRKCRPAIRMWRWTRWRRIVA